MPASPETLGSPRYWAWLFSPPPLRAVLEPLLEIEQQIRAVLAPGLDHRVAHARLEWWREECARFARGAPVHPLTRRLLAASADPARLDPGDLPQPAGLVEAALWDLAAATFETRAELAGYCERWASALVEIAARAALESGAAACGSGPARKDAARFGLALGAALKELELLVALEGDARHGRLRLPLEELERAGLEPAALSRPPWPHDLCRLLEERHCAAREALSRAVARLEPDSQPALRGLLVWAAVAHRRSTLAERALPNAWRDGRASRLVEVAHAWHAARRADRREFTL